MCRRFFKAHTVDMWSVSGLPLMAALLHLSQVVVAGPGAWYTAAVVEYASPSLPTLPADLVLQTNAISYLKYINEAAKYNVDIIVFPEGGLHGHNSNAYMNVPSPLEGVTPCASNTTYHTALVTLSCGARDAGLYLVVNLNEQYFNPISNSTEHYNTNVAFDRNGTIIGRYRKFNPYGEPVTKPTTPDHHVIQTDFGVTFGMFICFDMVFMEPAITLARDFNIRHFVFPHCWVSELPFLTAIQAQWGWAYSLDVVLLAAGCNNLSAGGTGSGIYQGRSGPLQVLQSDVPASRMLIANVSKNLDHYNVSEGAVVTVVDQPEGGGNSSLTMLRDYLEVYDSIPLFSVPEKHIHFLLGQKNSSVEISTVEDAELCQKQFCCHFKVEMSTNYSKWPVVGEKEDHRGDDFSGLYYRLVAVDGVRWYGEGLATGGIQVCGVVGCVDETLASCGLRADDASRHSRPYRTNTQFHRISITADFHDNSTFVFPDVLVTGVGDQFGRLLPSSQVTFQQDSIRDSSLRCLLTVDSPRPGLVSAALYARQFDRDGQHRTVMAPSYASYSHGHVVGLLGSLLFAHAAIV